jgi:hypothetical protein
VKGVQRQMSTFLLLLINNNSQFTTTNISHEAQFT